MAKKYNTKHFKCVVCGKDIIQKYVVSCPVRKFCSSKCKWTFDNHRRGNKPLEKKEQSYAKDIQKYRKEYNKRYYEVNKANEIERVKAYYNENKKRLAEISKQRRHKDINEQNRKKENSRKWYRENKEHFYKYKAEYEKENPDKVFAHCKVKKALSSGEINRQPCEICGSLRTDAHHDDYDKPLDVRWLCRSCHKEWHLHNNPKRGTL